MAKLRFYQPVDMLGGDTYPLNIVEVGRREVIVSDGAVGVLHGGNFDIEDDLIVGGTLDEMIGVDIEEEQIAFKAKGIDADFIDYLDIWSDEDFTAAASFLLIGDDKVKSSDGHDVLAAWDGDDRMAGGDGDDTLVGGFGDDRLKGQDGTDVLFGDAGRDRLAGGDGNDILFGGEGRDKLKGQAGKDLLVGEDGDDVLVGGGGLDTFVFDADDGRDLVKDFQLGVDFLAFIDGTAGEVEFDRVSGGTLVTFGETEVMLRDVSDLDPSEFLFV